MTSSVLRKAEYGTRRPSGSAFERCEESATGEKDALISRPICSHLHDVYEDAFESLGRLEVRLQRLQARCVEAVAQSVPDLREEVDELSAPRQLLDVSKGRDARQSGSEERTVAREAGREARVSEARRKREGRRGGRPPPQT